MKNLPYQIGFNTLIQGLGKIIHLAASGILIGFLTRFLGPIKYGEYTTIFAYTGFFAILSEFGLDQVLVKELAKIKGNKERSCFFLSGVLSLRLILIIISVVLAVFLSIFLPYSLTVRLGILIASLSFFFNYSTSALMSYFQVKLNFLYIVIADVLGKIVITLISIFFLLFLRRNVILLVSASVFGSFISLLTICLFIKKERLVFSLNFKPDFLRKIFFSALPLFLISLLNQFFFRIDIPILSLIKGDGAVGIYGLAFKIFEFSAMPSTFFTATIFPVLAGQIENKELHKFTFKKSFLFLLLIGLTFSIGIYFLSPLLIRLFAGKEFMLATLPLKILCGSLILLYLSGLLTINLIILEKQSQLFVIYLLASFLNISLNLYLIKKLSFIGASLSSVATQFFIFLTAGFLNLRELKK